MVDFVQNLQIVYNKWEEKNPASFKFSSAISSPWSTKMSPQPPPSSSPALPSMNAAADGNRGGESERRNGLNPGYDAAWHRGGGGGPPPPPAPRVLHTSHARWRKYDSYKFNQTNSSNYSVLSYFKNEPTILAGSMAGKRPYVGLCCNKCLPVSRVSFVDEVAKTFGLNNLLLVPSMNPDNGYFVRKFYYLSHVFSCRTKVHFADVSGEVLDCGRVSNAVEKAAMQDSEENEFPSEIYPIVLKKHAKRAYIILQTMKSRMSRNLLSFIQWVVFKLLSRLLTSIQVQKGQLEILKQSSKSSLPLIFVPLHRSHLDYILVTFILVNNKIKAPLVAAGDNLRIPIIGTLLRGLGAFFIKRKMDLKSGKRDHVYRAVLHTYMEKSLSAGHNLEFFIEGGRSRTGKSCLPKGGLLSVVLDAYLDGSVSDALMVPVAINYDKLMDGNFVSEQLGNPKKMESLSSALKALWRVLSSNFGNVRVDFAQPFSLKELVQSIQFQGMGISRPLPSTVIRSSSPPLPQSQLRRMSSTMSLYGKDAANNHVLVKCLAEHITYDATHCMSMMSTNLLAFLLINKYRQGATWQQVVHSMRWLLEEVHARGRDVGFEGDAADVVDHATSVLGPELVHRAELPLKNDVDERNSSIVLLKPATDLPHVIELSYYSNVAVSLFLMDSVIANALHALVEEEFSSLRDCDGNYVMINREQLQEKALALCRILQFEFIFVPCCSSLSMIIAETIDRFIGKDILLTTDDEITDSKHRDWAKRFASTLTWDSETEEEESGYVQQQLKINLADESFDQLELYSNALSPVIESYWLFACNLPLLVQTQMEESEFLKRTQLSISNRIAAGLVLHAESLSADALRNASKLFESRKILESCVHDNVKLLFLSEEYDNEDKLTEVIEMIEEFKK